jgi:peptidylprolyl isomerase
MPQAKEGDTVQVKYTGTLQDGTVFDASSNDEPLAFTIGSGRILPDFEQAVVGLNVGESTTISIAAESADGAYRDDLVLVIDSGQFPPDLNPEVGQHLQLTQQDGQQVTVLVKEVAQENVTLDANHPLAGQDLNFEIELLAIQ